MLGAHRMEPCYRKGSVYTQRGESALATAVCVGDFLIADKK